jgi:hypothetical protein
VVLQAPVGALDLCNLDFCFSHDEQTQ